jgi:hypothetical protein
MSSDKKIKQETLNLYKSWRNEEIFCPAFKERVHFTLLGWNHLVGNNVKHRSVRDVYRRLKLLPLAKEIIAKSGTIQTFRIINGVTTYGLDSIETIFINGVSIVVKVRVVIIDTKSGKKFLSIMDRKLK